MDLAPFRRCPDLLDHLVGAQQHRFRNREAERLRGGQIDDEIRKYAGADAYGKDAMAAVSLAKQWLEGK